MNILVIGGTGVLSATIAARFVEAGHHVFIVTDGRGPLPAPSGIQAHLIIDRRDIAGMRNSLDSTRVKRWDIVVDCIGFDEEHANVLLNLIRDRVEHIFIISTTFVYSPNSSLPLHPGSELGTARELGGYAANKLRMETVWNNAWNDVNFPVTIIRCPHVLAPGCSLGAVPLHNRDDLLLSRLRRNRPLLLADGGRQVFQVVWGEDVANLILNACGKAVSLGKTYNCAHPEILTGRTYFGIIANALGVPCVIHNVPAEAVIKSGWGWNLSCIPRVYDLSSLKSDFNWLPPTPPSAAIATCIDFLNGNYGDSRLYEPDSLYDNLNKIEAAGVDVTERLTVIARTRPRSAIDIRMNMDPTPQA